jgi:hypothetical protein
MAWLKGLVTTKPGLVLRGLAQLSGVVCWCQQALLLAVGKSNML